MKKPVSQRTSGVFPVIWCEYFGSDTILPDFPPNSGYSAFGGAGYDGEKGG